MSNITKITGHCLCGKVKIKANNVNNKVTACHCGICRRWGGGPLMSLDCGTEVVFNGDCNISVYHSSQWAERGFCNQCGSHLFYRLIQSGLHFIPVGLFDHDLGFILHRQVFIDRKPTFYCFENKTEKLTEAEAFSQYA